MMIDYHSSGQKRLLLSFLIAALTGCSGNTEMIELQNWVNEQINQPPGPIEPIPEPVVYEPFTYRAAGLRQPFDIPLEIAAAAIEQQESGIQPDEDRPREPLESFALANLSMTGSIGIGNTLWVLIRDETGMHHNVTVGNYLGRNHGQITSVSETQINVTEIVPNGTGGWMERPTTLVLESVDEAN